MRLPILLALALALGGASASLAAPAAVPTPSQVAAIAEARRIGRDLYDFDQAAWVSTDAMLAKLPDPNGAGVKGWIVEREPGGAVATYYGLRDGKGYKIFVAHVQGRKVSASHVVAAGEDDAMTPIEQRMVAARGVAISIDGFKKAGVVPCERAAFNSVVLVPARADDPVSIYVLTPQTANDRYPFGGHYRIDVATDGSIVNSRAFTKSCIAMAPSPTEGGKPAGMFITHILDAQPTEIHVWLSLVAGLPVYIATTSPRELWSVDRGMVRFQQMLGDGSK